MNEYAPRPASIDAVAHLVVQPATDPGRPMTRAERRLSAGVAYPTNAAARPPVVAKPLSWRFPALDGVRGIAVLTVMLYHTSWSPRGLFGVDVFFVVSGFLITLLLLRELSTTGRVHIGLFFVRRVKRLIPALLITLALVLAAAWWLSDLRELTEIADRAWWTLWQAANWSQIVEGSAYWDASGRIEPLAAMWSLSITEQFYLVWPFLVIAVWFVCRKSPRALAIVLIVLTAGAALVAPLLWDGENSDRLYLGTDARAVAFVAGAAAAAVVFWIHGRTRRRSTPRRVTRVLVTLLSSLVLAALLTASVLVSSYHDARLYQGGLAAVAVAAAVFVATLCIPGNALIPFFSFSVFRGIGVVSYSIFLLHLPVFWMLQKLTPTIAPLTLFIVGGSITWLLAAFVHHGITERIRKAGWKPLIALPLLAVSIATVAAGSYFLPIVRAQQAATTSVSQAESTMPKGIEGGRPLVLTLGDSLANDFASALSEHGSDAVAVVDAGQGGCGLMDDTGVRATSGYVWDTRDCPAWRDTWKAALAAQPTDVVLVHLGWDAGEHYIGNTWIGPADPQFRQDYATALDDLVTSVATEAPQARLVLVTDRPTDGIISEPAAKKAFNQLLFDAADRHPNVAVADMGTMLCPSGPCRTTDDSGRPLFLPDNVHLSPSGRDFLAPWLEQFLRDMLLDR